MTSNGSAFPRIRNVEFFPVHMEKDTQIAVRDPMAYTDQVLVLSPLACFIAAHLDGQSGIPEIQASFAQQFDKRILPPDTILQVVQTLDEHFLLEDERFYGRRQQVLDEFKKAIVREPAHSEGVYLNEPKGLCKQLDGYFTHPQGPGTLQLASPKGKLAGIVSPHIDFHRGGPAYAWAYREILSRNMADLYVILGVAHMSPPTPFVVTDKSYATPLGSAETDRDFVHDLTKNLDWNSTEYEIVHRKEHSIEFQAVFLRYCAQQRGQNFKILPILVSGLAGEDSGEPEKNDPRTQAFLGALTEKLRKYPGKTCLVAGVDLSHIGRKFGDDFDITQERLSWMERLDRSSIDKLVDKDPKGWLQSVKPERKVCGLGALYAFTRIMRELHPKAKGNLLHYAYAPDPSGGEVSFASMNFLH